MNQRENMLKLYRHEQTDAPPSFFASTHGIGFGAMPGPWIEKGPLGGGLDGFGVEWVTPASGGGAPIPAPDNFILEDVTEWKDSITIPDVDAFDWEKSAREEITEADRAEKVIDFGCGNSVFERLSALMGFEESLIAMASEPESVNELFTAITDYKIKMAERVARYYKADVFTNYDDIATERNLFISPDTYRTLVKPHHKRLNDAVKDLGMIPIYHCCGKAESLVEDFIDCGYEAWTSVQPTNDIASILENYGDRFALLGGYNTTGRPGMADATEDEVKTEVRRCFEEYGHYQGYCFFGFKIVNSLDPQEIRKALLPLVEESIGCSRSFSQK